MTWTDRHERAEEALCLDNAAQGSVRLRAVDRGEQRTLHYFDGHNPLLRDDGGNAAGPIPPIRSRANTPIAGQSAGDTPSALGHLALSWPYRENVLDLETRRPLPPEIYRRRRALAIGVAGLVAVIVIAILFMVFSGGNSQGPKKTTEPNTSQGPLGQPQDPGVKTPVVPPVQQSVEPTPTPTAAVEPPPVLKPGDDCPDSTLAVKGLTNEPRYVIGDQPKFTMVVTNIGLTACQRDVGAAVLAAYVYTLDNKRLWSNLDCAPSNETLVKSFNPGEQVTTEVTWTGMGSEPQCPLPRQPIGPGTYNLVVQLGNLRSATVPFVLAESAADAPAPPPPAPEAPAPAPAG